MHINKILGYLSLAATLAGCSGTTTRDTWYSEYGTLTTGTPSQMIYGTPAGDTGTHRMAVLLPLSGDNAQTGRAIRTGIEAAIMQRAPQSLYVSFYDTGADTTSAINAALNENPEIIVGPLFAADARTLRAMKPSNMPAISFTSDASAIGNGVMTMALMPSNGIETIVREISATQSRGIAVLAPDNHSGHMMAAAARAAATAYDIPTAGVIYYREKDTDSIKNAAMRATLYNARSAANKRAKEILSDILNTERLTAVEKSSMSRQLDKISKVETLGRLPYDAVLFLGTADDAKSIASFMRYYGLTSSEAAFYGTAMWDGADLHDLTLAGAKYPALVPTSPAFETIYTSATGTAPARIASFGYDAANLATGMVYSNQTNAAYLLNPGGYVGVDGLFRLTPSGASQRAMRIMQTASDGTVTEIRPAPVNFMTPIYSVEPSTLTPAREMEIETPGINPMTYIQIPDRLRSKYKSKTYGANMNQPQPVEQQNIVTILPEDDSDTIIVTDPGFQTARPESVSRQYIDEIEIYE